MKYNYGKLKDSIIPQQNIIYYRKLPKEISINLTNKCPNSCVFCIRDCNPGWNVSNLYLEKEPSLKEIEDEFEKAFIQNSKIEKIKICGYGEPLIRLKILPDLIAFLRKKLPFAIIQLTTSGWPIIYYENGEELFIKCVENGLNQVYLGLHATNYKDYIKVVRPKIDGKIAFNQTLKFIKLVKSLGLNIVCAFVEYRKLPLEKIDNLVNELECEYEIRKFEK